MISWMYNHCFSYKKPKATPTKVDLVKQEVLIKLYEKLLTKTSEDEPILFGDDVHPTMATKMAVLKSLTDMTEQATKN